MTNWMPELSRDSVPRYIAIADALETDVQHRRLQPGDKLPPQRDLAYRLGVTIGTVGRAYALARQRGLVSGEVGRGTYVLDTRRDERIETDSHAEPLRSVRFMIDRGPDDRIRLDTSSAIEVGQAEIIRQLVNEILGNNPLDVTDYTRRQIRSAWRNAGARWMSTRDWTPEPENIIPALGVHAAAVAVINAITATGDRVAFEELTYNSISRSITLCGRRPVSVGMDDEGLDPDAFERVCAQQHPKAFFTIPTLHNPTLAIMSEDRRRRIVDIAHRYNVWLIEDNIYGCAMDDGPPNIAELAPELTFHLGGLSKVVSAGIRGGWVACPPGTTNRVFMAHKMMTGGMPFLLAELAAQLVLTGQADAIRKTVLAEVARREAAARQVFDGLAFSSHPNCSFLWMTLPEPWLPGTFRSASMQRNIMIDGSDEFRVDREGSAHHNVRFGFSSPASVDDLRGIFETLRNLIRNGPVEYDNFE